MGENTVRYYRMSYGVNICTVLGDSKMREELNPMRSKRIYLFYRGIFIKGIEATSFRALDWNERGGGGKGKEWKPVRQQEL
jgi:hypothetical protein